MTNLRLSVSALLVLFSSAVFAAPVVSTPVDNSSANTTTNVDNSYHPSKAQKIVKKAKNHSHKKLTKKYNKATKKKALCKDGTYSKSKSRKGTCSKHGGVAKWL
ncbi:MAG: DUF3761 domain-containing protein [Enterobacteriaceae bacterium]|jgi:Skp family chaperone for outer membrane proteins|nr:DUF3761 domain-containing protein [Enterobacteriaceae bacterium]